MAVVRTREGPMATVNVWTALTTLGSQGTLNAITVPAGMNSIKEIWGVFCEPAPADTSGGVICARLRGTGLKYGEQKFVFGGMGVEVTGNESYTASMVPTKLKVDVATIPGGEIWIDGAQFGTDHGTPELAVSLWFSESGAAERYYYTRMIATATLDTDAMAITDVSDTVNAIQPPGNCKHIYSVTTAMHGIVLVTASGGTGYIRMRGGIAEGEQVFVAGGAANLSTTTGVDGGYAPAVQRSCYLTLTGAPLLAYAAQCGVDWGTPYGCVCVEVGP